MHIQNDHKKGKPFDKPKIDNIYPCALFSKFYPTTLPSIPPLAPLSRNNARRASRQPRGQSTSPLQSRRRTLPDIRCDAAATGCIKRPGQRDRSHLLRSHRLLVTRFTDPTGVLLLLWPGISIGRKFLHIPGTSPSAGKTQSLQFRWIQRFVIPSTDRAVIFCCRIGRFAARLPQVCCRCSNQSEDATVRYFLIRPVLAEIGFRLLQIVNYGDTVVYPDLMAE